MVSGICARTISSSCFPQSFCSRRQNGVIRDLDWEKDAIVLKSVEAHRDGSYHFEGGIQLLL